MAKSGPGDKRQARVTRQLYGCFRPQDVLLEMFVHKIISFLRRAQFRDFFFLFVFFLYVCVCGGGGEREWEGMRLKPLKLRSFHGIMIYYLGDRRVGTRWEEGEGGLIVYVLEREWMGSGEGRREQSFLPPPPPPPFSKGKKKIKITSYQPLCKTLLMS